MANTETAIAGYIELYFFNNKSLLNYLYVKNLYFYHRLFYRCCFAALSLPVDWLY
jgi:hypothetical protein